ncbi:hypothetical protein C2E23DRAFT_412835 [Lenzites betulinus]|nr:hypothetical protein C2E23DRAFT_412835 [Lenzites betulinus]
MWKTQRASAASCLRRQEVFVQMLRAYPHIESGVSEFSEDEESSEVDLFRIVGLLNGSGRFSGFRIFARAGDTVWDWRLTFSLWKAPTTPSCGLIYGSLPRATLEDVDWDHSLQRARKGIRLEADYLLWDPQRLVEEASAARLCVVTPPLPRDAGGGVKVILWNIEGHDQGWGGELGCEGTFSGAYSWYEACIFRKCTPSAHQGASDDDNGFWDDLVASQDVLLNPDDILPDIHRLGYTVVPNEDGQTTWLVQRNRVADDTCGRYEVKWDDRAPSSYIDSILTWMYQWNDTHKGQQATMGGYGIGKGFLDALRPGDRVGLWARAQYIGWENVLRDATVKICF